MGSQPRQRKAFSFKKAKSTPPVVEADRKSDPAELSEVDRIRPVLGPGPGSPDLAATIHRLKDTRGQYIEMARLETLSDSPSDNFSLTIEDVEGCIIDLCDKPLLPALSDRKPTRQRRCTALYMSRVKNTIIVIGHTVMGSILLQQLQDCIVVAGAQQVGGSRSSTALQLLKQPSADHSHETVSFARIGALYCTARRPLNPCHREKYRHQVWRVS